MKFRASMLALCFFALPVSVGAQSFSATDPAENPAESTGSVTFEFSARASAERVALDDSFTVEVSVVQKWGDALENLSLDIPGLESFRQIDEQEKQNDFIDFRGEATYDTTYLLTLAPTATGIFVIGPVAVHDESGQLMESDPIRVEVTAPVGKAVAAAGEAHALSSAPQRSTAAGSMLPYILAVLGTLAVLLVALYFALSLSGGRSKSEPVPEISPEPTPLPSGFSDERALFAELARRYGRDVRSLTTREIALLEADPEDRVRVTALLDRVRAARYADRP